MKTEIVAVSKQKGGAVIEVAGGRKYEVKTRLKLAEGDKVELKVVKRSTSNTTGTATIVCRTKVRVEAKKVNSGDGRKF